MKTIIIEVKTDGTLTIEGKGFKGSECEKATQAMEQALGVKTASKKTPEYRQVNTQTT